MPSPHRAPGPLLRPAALGLLALALLAWAPAQAAPQAEEPAVVVLRLLSTSPQEGVEVQELTAALVAVGSAGVEPMLEALAGQALLDGPLRGLRREATLDALAQLPRPAVLAALQRANRPEATSAQRIAALDTLGRMARSSEIHLMLRLGAPERAEGGHDLTVERAFEAAAAGLLERHPGSLEALAAQLRSADPSLLVALVRQMGRCRSETQLEVLASKLGQVPGADVLLLGEIESLAPQAPRTAVHRVRPAVRALLDEPDPFVCLAACRAVVALEDPESVESLIDLLGAREELVRDSALRALEPLTGQWIGRDPEAWDEWYRGELAWWRGDALRYRNVLRMGPRRDVPRALMGLARGRLFREEIVPLLEPYLRDTDPDVVRLTISVLSTLAAPEALPGLVAALGHPDPAVAKGAHKALRRITGHDLGTEPTPWLELPH